MSEAPFATLEHTLAQVWQSLEAGLRDRSAPARHPALASVGLAGGGEARIVVLRGVDRGAGALEVHTDSASAKVAELSRAPRATLLIWDPDLSFQIRLRVTVEIETGNAEAWARIPESARKVYGGAPHPGGAIATPREFTPAPSPARFAVLKCLIDEIETLHLGAVCHTRARFSRRDGFAGRWVAP
ncbi:MAG: pyridoxamine 5'-phosphate oxidase family protein [Paracoccaceae bacterium]